MDAMGMCLMLGRIPRIGVVPKGDSDLKNSRPRL
jgi:hypothetical protein